MGKDESWCCRTAPVWRNESDRSVRIALEAGSSRMSAGVGFRLLNQFESTFHGKMYRHRASNVGDLIAVHLYEDLLDLALSSKLVEGVREQKLVVNVANLRRGIKAGVATALLASKSLDQRPRLNLVSRWLVVHLLP